MPLFEALENRRLLSGEPWGAYPRLIDQDSAIASHADVTGAGQTIAILDTGVDYHQALLGGGFGVGHKVVAGYDFVNNDANPDDVDGHGTGVATIAAGGSYVYGGYAYRGIAPQASIVALRIDDGSGIIPEWRYEAALQWVLDHRVEYNITVINISEGGDEMFTVKTTNNSSYADELAALKAAGVFIIVSAGNDEVTTPPSIEYPAADPSAFSAGSINGSDLVAAHSSRASILDILAPGERVPTAYLNDQDAPVYLQATGTSFASPFIAGAAALIKQVNPDFTPDEVMDILVDSGASVYDPATGLTFARLDLDNAIALAMDRSQQEDGIVGENATDNDIVVGSNGRLYLGWYDSVGGSLKFATRSANGEWSGYQVVDDSADVGKHVSVALDPSKRTGMAYYDASTFDLKYAIKTTTGWIVKRVDSTGKTGVRPSLAFDPQGNPGISYYDATNKDLRFVTLVNGSWRRYTVDSSGDAGRYSGVAWDPARGQWAIAYEKTTGSQVRYATRTSGGSWEISLVDDTPRGGQYISLAFDSSGRPALSYYESYRGDVKFAHFIGGQWRAEIVASSGTQGQYSDLVFDGAVATIVYYNQSTNSISAASGDLGHWSILSLLTGGGMMLSAALGPGDHLSLAFLQSGSDVLHFADF